MTVLVLPPPGSSYWRDGEASLAAFPSAGAVVGEARIAVDTGSVYYWDGASWSLISATASAAAVRALLSASSPLLYNSATGIFSIQVATGAQNGYLSSADWTTFNAKQPAISSGTTSQYWRGDKIFQTLNVAALSAVTDGSAAAAGKVSEILSAAQAANTTTGVGSTGAWGNVTSVSLTAGRWLVWATAAFNENSAVLTTSLSVGISASSSGAGIDEFATTQAPFETSGANDAVLSSPPTAVNISSTTTYYANTRFYYSSGSPQHRGRITAQRIG